MRLLGREHLEIVRAAGLVLNLCQSQAFRGRLLGARLRRQDLGIALESQQAVRDVLKSRQHRGPVVRRGLLSRGHGRSPLMQELPALEQRLRDRSGDVPNSRCRREEVGEFHRVGAVAAAQAELRQHVRRRDADLRGGLVQQRRVLTHVGSLFHQLRRHAHGQILRQAQAVELKRRARIARREGAHIGREQIPLLGELGLEPGQGRERRLQHRLLLQHVHPGGAAGPDAPLGDVELRALHARDLRGRRHLCAQRRFGDGGGHDIRGEREVAGLEQASLVIRLRLQRFDLAANAAEDVERVGDVHARAVQRVEIGAVAGQADGGERGVGALRLKCPREARKKCAALGSDVLVGLFEGSLRGFEGRAVLQCLLDQPVELGRLEQRPPLPRNVLRSDEALRLAAGDRCGHGGLGQRLVFGQIRIGIARRRRGLEVGPDGARDEDRRGERNARRTPRPAPQIPAHLRHHCARRGGAARRRSRRSRRPDRCGSGNRAGRRPEWSRTACIPAAPPSACA